MKLTGGAGYAADAIEVFTSINGTLLSAALTRVIVLLVAIYRSPIFLFIPLAAVMFAETLSRSVGYGVSELGVTINGQSSSIMSILVLGAGTDYALLIVARYREELHKTDDRHVAVRVPAAPRRASRSAGRPARTRDGQSFRSSRRGPTGPVHPRGAPRAAARLRLADAPGTRASAARSLGRGQPRRARAPSAAAREARGRARVARGRARQGDRASPCTPAPRPRWPPARRRIEGARVRVGGPASAQRPRRRRCRWRRNPQGWPSSMPSASLDPPSRAAAAVTAISERMGLRPAAPAARRAR